MSFDYLPQIEPLSLLEFVELDHFFVRQIEREKLRSVHFDGYAETCPKSKKLEAQTEAFRARSRAREYADILNLLRSHYLTDPENAYDLL